MAQPLVVPAEPIDWDLLRMEFFKFNLQPERVSPYTLKDLSEKYGVDYGTIRNQAATEKWRDELKMMIDERREEMKRMILDNSQIEGEIEVRLRQAHVSRLCISKALLALEKLNPDKMKPMEIIMLMDLGLKQERASLGLSETFIPPTQSTTQNTKVERAVNGALQAMERLKARRLIEAPRESESAD
jgi:hypothetical protein